MADREKELLYEIHLKSTELEENNVKFSEMAKSVKVTAEENERLLEIRAALERKVEQFDKRELDHMILVQEFKNEVISM